MRKKLTRILMTAFAAMSLFVLGACGNGAPGPRETSAVAVVLPTIRLRTPAVTLAPAPSPAPISAPSPAPTPAPTPMPTPFPTPFPTPLPTPTPTPRPSRGYAQNIPQEIRENMAGISMPAGAKTAYDDLAYLTVYYLGFDGGRAQGNLVVAKELAEEMLDIFDELYKLEYPIESIRLIDEFQDQQTDELNSLDRASMGNNNTSAFCYRVVSGSENLSQHALGRAVDINPKINPYVLSSGFVSPANAKKYADRSGEGLSGVEKAALIQKGGAVYDVFISRGWEWGGDWRSEKDYQHFQKKRETP